MGTGDLFSHAAEQDQSATPLAERLRPRRLDDFVGQRHLVGEGQVLRRAIEADRVPSMILWGPPGTGKTTLARIIARTTRSEFVPFSAVLGGVKEIREIMAAGRDRWAMHRKRTILFIDEIHRFNKAQQDALLPHVERGTVVLIGATTENPSFEVNAALLSRCRLFTLKSLTEDDLAALVRRGLAVLGLTAEESVVRWLVQHGHGDARRMLTALELAADITRADEPEATEMGEEAVRQALQQGGLRHDKGGEQHYDVVSAFIKSLRGSDPDAAVYWMARMLEGGEPPRFVLRRMIIFAAEDVGLADPRALQVAMSAAQAFEWVGLPEGRIPMAMAATYLATAPKSNAAYLALGEASAAVEARGPLDVPLHLRNAPTKLMKELGYGRAYRYPHDFDGGWVAETYLPEVLSGTRFYRPKGIGAEAEIAERLETRRREVEAAERGRAGGTAPADPSGGAAPADPSGGAAGAADPGPGDSEA